MSHPIRDPEGLAEVERKAQLLQSYSSGKVTVEYHMKDGKWKIGNVSVTFPRRHE